MMKRLFLLGTMLLLAATTALAAPSDELLKRLEALDGVTQTAPLSAGTFAAKYEVMLSQSLDWNNPEAGQFSQRILVMHVGYDRPTIFITQGYQADFGLAESYRDELSALFDANIVLVEHRYFGRSVPKELDWRHLTAENSAFDLHRIRSLFGQIYSGKWIASGISKGGTTTMLYAAYFPGDVDAYVPYVGPLCKSVEDKKFNRFLSGVGTPAERAAVEAFQIELLRRKAQLLPAFEAFCGGKGCSFRLPVSEIFDYCVLEYAISFWQWGLDAANIPELSVSDDELLKELFVRVDPDYFRTGSAISPFFVQAARELGYYPYDLKPFRKYISLHTTRDYLRRIFLPEELKREKFSKKLYNKIADYLTHNDPRMMMIYGGNDPWTAPGAGWCVSPEKRNMKLFIQPGGSHRTRIATLPEAERLRAIEILRGWLEN